MNASDLNKEERNKLAIVGWGNLGDSLCVFCGKNFPSLFVNFDDEMTPGCQECSFDNKNDKIAEVWKRILAKKRKQGV